MNNAERIKALRRCSYITVAEPDREDGYCKPCAYFTEDSADVTCIDRMMIDAADALEAAEKRIDNLQQTCNKLATNLQQAQLPKEGEWLRTDAFPHRIYCSVCYKTYVPNDRWQIWVDDELPKNYCPNCGAKMRGEHDEH